jgi:hypothetical protein
MSIHLPLVGGGWSVRIGYAVCRGGVDGALSEWISTQSMISPEVHGEGAWTERCAGETGIARSVGITAG